MWREWSGEARTIVRSSQSTAAKRRANSAQQRIAHNALKHSCAVWCDCLSVPLHVRCCDYQYPTREVPLRRRLCPIMQRGGSGWRERARVRRAAADVRERLQRRTYAPAALAVRAEPRL